MIFYYDCYQRNEIEKFNTLDFFYIFTLYNTFINEATLYSKLAFFLIRVRFALFLICHAFEFLPTLYRKF